MVENEGRKQIRHVYPKLLTNIRFWVNDQFTVVQSYILWYMTRQHLHFFKLAFGKFPKLLYVFQGGIFLRFWKFLKWLDIWGVSQKPRHLGNSPNVWIFGKFPKCLGILEISSHLRNFQNLKNIPSSNICRYLRNFPDTQAFGKFLFLTFLIIVVTPSYGRLVCRNPGVLQITVNPFNLQVLNQTKKIPMIQLSSPIKIWGQNWSRGSWVMIGHKNKQTNRQA